MNALEIVKLWNKKKGTSYAFVRKNEDSAIVKAIKGLIIKFGEEKINEYFEYKLNDEEQNDLWINVNEYEVKTFLREKENKEMKEKIENKEAQNLNVLSILGNEIVKLLGTELSNNIGKEVEKKIEEFVENKVITKVYEYKDEHKKVQGISHEKLDTVLKFVAMDEPVMLTGPAGTGKNVIAKQVADVLGLDFYFSNAVTQEYKITGYGDANGNFVKTQFYEAFTKGGIFLLDEIDASCPEALIVLNCAIANRYFDFPVIGRVNAHPNFRVMANANTFGTGASMEYVGRNQLDGATLNRFALVEVDYDRRIEDSVCPDKDIADFCREFRKICVKNGIHHIISYRELSRLYKMICIAKLDKVEALKTCLIKGLEKDTLRMIFEEMNETLEYKKELKKVINN